MKTESVLKLAKIHGVFIPVRSVHTRTECKRS